MLLTSYPKIVHCWVFLYQIVTQMDNMKINSVMSYTAGVWEKMAQGFLAQLFVETLWSVILEVRRAWALTQWFSTEIEIFVMSIKSNQKKRKYKSEDITRKAIIG